MMKFISINVLFIVIVAGIVSFFEEEGNTTQPSPAASITRGKKVYEMYCLACHQADGLGVTRLNPPLAKTSFVLGDKKKLIGIVLNGFDELIEIDGDTYSNVMASQDFLKDKEIADVLTYVRNSFGNKASAILPSEVTSVRAARKTN